MNDYNTMSYPHSQHRRFVRGCEECLQRTKAAQARYTESRRRIREQQRARCDHRWQLEADDMRVCEKCFHRTTL